MRWVILFLFLLTGCCKEPEQVSKLILNREYQVVFLFEVDGCKVYRFDDSLIHHYFTSCKGSTFCAYTSGKPTKDETIPTN